MSIPDPYADRESYRTKHAAKDLTYFRVSIDETDLHIGAKRDLSREAAEAALEARRQVLEAIETRPRFRTSLEPLRSHGTETALVEGMLEAGRQASVGPMAAVAGAIAESVGRALLPLSREVIVENGGDIFLYGPRERHVAVFAGDNPLSGLLAVVVQPTEGLGVCTSSGTVGHSLSLGRADAALVIARSCALADAAATRLGNLAADADRLDAALDEICAIPGVDGALVIVGEKLGVKGQVRLETVGA